MERQDLIIWISDGQTMMFENVSEFEWHTLEGGYIKFIYDGVSTGKTRSAVFFLKDIMGYALSNDKAAIQ